MTIQTIPVPGLCPFSVPKDATIESAKAGLSMMKYCQQHLTTANFETSLPPGPVGGGFLPMDHCFSPEEALFEVQELAHQTGRKFRLGTPLEILLYKAQNLPHPNYFVVPIKVGENILHWSEWNDGGRFGLNTWHNKYNRVCKVFVVEDL